MKIFNILLAIFLASILTACDSKVEPSNTSTSTSPEVTKSKVESFTFINRFGYRDGQLLYKPLMGKNKAVYMSEQTTQLLYKCSALVANTQHSIFVEVVAAVAPSVIWESEYHRLVAVYAKGDDKNEVTANDVMSGVANYVGQWQERMCTMAKRSVNDFLSDPGLVFAEVLTEIAAEDVRSPFDIKVQTVKVILPDELVRAVAVGQVKVQPPSVKKPESKPTPKPPVKQASKKGCHADNTNVSLILVVPACVDKSEK